MNFVELEVNGPILKCEKAIEVILASIVNLKSAYPSSSVSIIIFSVCALNNFSLFKPFIYTSNNFKSLKDIHFFPQIKYKIIIESLLLRTRQSCH